MAVTEGQVDIASSSLQVVAPSTGRLSRGSLASRVGPTRCVVVKNTGPDQVFVGGTDVTVDTGIPITNGGSFTFWIYPDEEIWAVCAPTKTSTIAYFQSGG